MAPRLWIYPICLLSIFIFTFAATEGIKESVTCTFTNGKDCSYLLNLNNTTEYTIEKEHINRTGVKIIFDTEQGIEFLHVISGERLENRVRILNITRGTLNHLVKLSCSEEMQVNKIKLEPVIVSKEIQIDFVQGCGNESDPITIKSLYYIVGTDEDDFFLDASQRVSLKEETQTDGAYIPTGLGNTNFLTTSIGQQIQEEEEGEVQEEEEEDAEVEVSTVITVSHHLVNGIKPISKSTAKPMKETNKTPRHNNKISLKVGASKSSAQKVSHDIACLFLALCIFRNV